MERQQISEKISNLFNALERNENIKERDAVRLFTDLFIQMRSEEQNEKEFHTDRRMFYINRSGNVIDPIDNYKNLSHLEWFRALGIDIDEVPRGFCSADGKYAMVYIGTDFHEPTMNPDMLLSIKKHFPTIEYIGLGAKIGEVGKPWEPYRKVRVDIHESDSSSTRFSLHFE